MIFLYAFLTMSTGLGFDPIYGAGVEGDWRPADRVRIVAGADYASSQKSYLGDGWSVAGSGRIEYATGGPLLGLGAHVVHEVHSTYTKDAVAPFVTLGLTLEPGSRIYLDYSPDDGTENEVSALGFKWEYERRKWSAKLYGGMEQFQTLQKETEGGAYYGGRVAWRVR